MLRQVLIHEWFLSFQGLGRGATRHRPIKNCVESLYIATVPNRRSRRAILLRESFREERKVRHRTLTNLSSWPAGKIKALRQVLKGNMAAGLSLPQAFEIVRPLPHVHLPPCWA